MRDKLIQILQKHTPRAIGGLYINTADEILAALRCDKCRYWVGRNWESIGECVKLTDSPAVSINDAYSEGVHTEPGFFCALWEAKA